MVGGDSASLIVNFQGASMYGWFDNPNFPTVTTHVMDLTSGYEYIFNAINGEYEVFNGTGSNSTFSHGVTTNMYFTRNVYDSSSEIYGPYNFRFSGNNTINI